MQVFKIEIPNMKITTTLIRVLLRDYFVKMRYPVSVIKVQVADLKWKEEV